MDLHHSKAKLGELSGNGPRESQAFLVVSKDLLHGNVDFQKCSDSPVNVQLFIHELAPNCQQGAPKGSNLACPALDLRWLAFPLKNCELSHTLVSFCNAKSFVCLKQVFPHNSQICFWISSRQKLVDRQEHNAAKSNLVASQILAMHL